MNIRRFAAAGATAALSLAVFAAPAAAETPAWQCSALDAFLSTEGLYEDDHDTFTTTYSELKENYTEWSEDRTGDLIGSLPGVQVGEENAATWVADTALDCGLIKEDGLFGSSLSSDAGEWFSHLSS
ncbi:hypothetical protein [Corynebacterium sp. A21]|uniref:hypothetical protein n=1 Tax=Corynebacterium sp. A21 TaxID=3457318 RepID=UPI003FD64BF3